MEANDLPKAPGNRSHVWTWSSLAVVAAVVFVYLAVVGPSRSSHGTQGPSIGRKLPYLELQPLTGDAKWVSLRDLAGNVTVMNFWGTWCMPCRAEFADVVKLASQFGSRPDFRLLAVSCGEGRDDELDELRDETGSFLRARKVTLATYADQHASSRIELQRVLRSPLGYPTTLVLDRQGTIRGLWQGPIDLPEISDLVHGLLDERSGT